MTLTARAFVDGLFVANFIYDRYEYNDHLYIPVDQVPDDAVSIEIEVFPSLVQSESVTFTQENPSVIVEFESTDEVKPVLSDLYFYYGIEECIDRIPLDSFQLDIVDEKYNYLEVPVELIKVYRLLKTTGGIEGSYYDENGAYYTYEGQHVDKYDITKEVLSEKIAAGEVVEDEAQKTSNMMHIERDANYANYDKVVDGGSIIDRENKGVNFTILRRLRITAIDPEVFDKVVTIAIAKNPYYFTKTAQSVSFPIFNIHAENVVPVAEYTRVFRDGRLRSRNRYDFHEFNGKLQVRALEAVEARSTMSVDITPYRNRLIYFKEELDSELVDLRGFIDKPFDMRYYEVYLNGRRLNRLNVFPISPWEIKLAGIKSYYNLEIYERDRDWEYFDIEFNKYFTLSDFIRKTFMEKVYKDKLIHDVTGDTLPNVNKEEKEPWSREDDTFTILFSMFYVEMLATLGFINPEILQLNKEYIMENYDFIDQLYRVQNDKGEDVYLINPDIYYKPENIGEGERWRVYMVGENGDNQ